MLYRKRCSPFTARGRPTIPTAYLQPGSEPLRSGVRSTYCGASAGREPVKFTHHSLTKTILIQAPLPRKQHSTSTIPKYSVRPSANFQPGSARRWSISHSSPNLLRRPRRLPDGRPDRFGKIVIAPSRPCTLAPEERTEII